MALTAYQTNPQVVSGDVVEKRYRYVGDGSATFKKGELIRINTSGQVVVAGTDSDTTGAVHGMALETVDTATTDTIAVALFTANTVLRMQLYNATASDAEPQDVSIGSTYTLSNSSNKWAVTTTTTKGIATIVDKEATPSYFDDDTGLDEDYGFVRVQFAQAILDAHGA